MYVSQIIMLFILHSELYVNYISIKVEGKKVSQIDRCLTSRSLTPVECNKHFIKFPIFFSTVMLSSLPS